VDPKHRGWQRGGWRLLLRAVLAAVAVVGSLVWSGSAAPLAHATPEALPIAWSSPTQIDHQPPYDSGLFFDAVSCPSASMCVAADSSGNVVTSTDPSGGSGDWTTAAVDQPESLNAISCPTTSLCVAVDEHGDVVTSTDPTGGPNAWSTADVDGSETLNAVSCPSTDLCVATDAHGDIVASSDPTGGTSAWTVASVDGPNSLWAVSCPSDTLCVATGGDGNVVASTSPTGGPNAWSTADVDGSAVLTAVSCPAVSLCVATDQRGGIVTSTDPTGGVEAWSVARTAGQEWSISLSCPTTTLCVGRGDDGSTLVSTDPTGGAEEWQLFEPGFPQGGIALSCPSDSFCVTVGWDGTAYVSTDPTSNSWITPGEKIDGADGLDSVSCPSSTLCVAVDESGNVLASTDPDGGVKAWTVTYADPSFEGTGASCPTTAFCAIAGFANGQSEVLTSTDPTGGAGAWTARTVDATIPLEAISCPSISFCAATDGGGDVLTSTAPLGGTSSWNSVKVDSDLQPGNDYGGISCRSTSLCVAVDGTGNVLSSTDPTGGAAAWKTVDIDPSDDLTGISCPTDLQCTAVDARGNVYTSDDATGGADTWTENYIDVNELTGVSCPTVLFCAAVDWVGDVITSFDPAGGASTWTTSDVGGGNRMLGVSCPSTAFCVATDLGGDVVVGEPPPTVTMVSSVVGPTSGGTSVTISGTGLLDADAVDFGTTAAAIVGACTDTTCEVTAPAGSAGPVAVTVTTPIGTTSSTLTLADTFTYVTPADPEPYHPLTPDRICDTRTGQTKVACTGSTTLGPDGTLTVTAEGNGGVPASGVSAVVVNVTVADTTAQSHLTVFPGGQTEPTASNLNWVAGQTVPNLVTVGLSTAGTFEAENLNGDADVIVDVEGYYGPGVAGAGLYNALSTPARICDTRAGNPSGLSGSTLSQCQGLAPTPGNSLTVGVDGLGGIPSTGVGAVVLNVTAIGATASGHLTVYPAANPVPLVSDVNFTAGAAISNRVIVPVGARGAVAIQSSNGDPNILVDVAGWFTDTSNASATGTQFTPAVTPTRVCDTRSGLAYSTPCAGDTVAAGTSLTATVANTDGIPSGVSAVVLDVTVTDTTTTSHLTVSPAGQSVPTVSDLNWTAGRTVPNLAIATVGTDGQIDLSNFAGSTDVIVDVVGWYLPDTVQHEDLLAQSAVNVALTNSKAIYGNNQSYGATSAEMVALLTDSEASLTFVTDGVASSDPDTISVAIDSTGNGVMLVDQSVSGTCWAVVTNETATTGPTMAGNPIVWPEDTSAGYWYLAYTGSPCSADVAAVQTSSGTSSGWRPNKFPASP